jgi:ribose transport system ATP-binding protein
MAGAPVLLSFQEVTKQFTGTVVVDRVTFSVRAGSIVALLGANGAGKSTLIKVLAGVHPRDGGQILHRGRDVDASGGRSRLAFIHQDLGLIDWMTVAENMAFAYGFRRRGRLIDWRGTRERAREALWQVGGNIDPDARIFDLPRAEQSLVAIARALALDAEILVLDEPTASLPTADVDRLFEVLSSLRSRGVGMIYVTHRLDEVFRIADEIAVMRDGRLVAFGATSEMTEAAVVEHIVGGALSGFDAEPQRGPDEAADRGVGGGVTLRGVVVGDVGPIDLEIATGAIVGLAGLRGAGQELIGRALAGIQAVSEGNITLAGRSFVPRTPADAVARGVAFVTSNRETEALARGLSVRENLFINPAVRGRRLLSPQTGRRERIAAMAVIDRYGVRPPNSERAIETLSGGNQQKVVLARWLDVRSPLLILEEPTMGVDVGAKADIYRLVQEAAGRGTIVIVVSSDFEEIAAVCRKAYVFNRGRVAALLEGPRLSVGSLTTAASSITNSLRTH